MTDLKATLQKFNSFTDKLIKKTEKREISQEAVLKLGKKFTAEESETLLNSVFGLSSDKMDVNGDNVINFANVAACMGHGNGVDHREALAAKDNVVEAQIREIKSVEEIIKKQSGSFGLDKSQG